MFFALWPTDEVRSALAAAAQSAQAQCGGRATPAEKIHLTLFFIGSFDRARLASITDIGTSVRENAFDFAVDRVGSFRRKGIVWAGTSETPRELPRLVESLRTGLAGVGISGEERPYVPHVTLVRDAARRPADDILRPSTWRAREFALVESVPAGGGVRYQNIGVWPLAHR